MVSAGLDPWMLTKCFVSSKGCSVGSVKSLNIFRLTGRMGRSNLWSTRRRRRRNQLMCRVLVDKTSFLFYFSISIGPVLPGLLYSYCRWYIFNLRYWYSQPTGTTRHIPPGGTVYLVHSGSGRKNLIAKPRRGQLLFKSPNLFYFLIDRNKGI